MKQKLRETLHDVIANLEISRPARFKSQRSFNSALSNVARAGQFMSYSGCSFDLWAGIFNPQSLGYAATHSFALVPLYQLRDCQMHPVSAQHRGERRDSQFFSVDLNSRSIDFESFCCQPKTKSEKAEIFSHHIFKYSVIVSTPIAAPVTFSLPKRRCIGFRLWITSVLSLSRPPPRRYPRIERRNKSLPDKRRAASGFPVAELISQFASAAESDRNKKW